MRSWSYGFVACLSFTATACAPQPTSIVNSTGPNLVSVDAPPPGFPKQYVIRDKGVCVAVAENWIRQPDVAGHQVWARNVNTIRPANC